MNLTLDQTPDNGKRKSALNQSLQQPSLKVPPQDIEAEQAILSGCFVHPEIIGQVQTILSASDFYREGHGFIFEAMCSLGNSMDIVTLADRLKATGRLEQIGGASYLSTLQDFCSTSAGWKYHAEIVKEHSQRRQVITACWNAAEQAHQASENLSDILSGLNKVAGNVSLKRLAPFSANQTTVFDFICVDPPETKFILENLLPKGVVGAIIGQGGVSKSIFGITLAVGMATGRPVLKYFKPVSPVKVLGLFAEDPDEEIHRRVFFTVNSIFPEQSQEITNLLLDNLHLKSIMGQIKPLMKVEQGNPATSEYFEWLKRTIEAHKDLEVLILDPKSRFYGLDENSNDDNTAFVACLEELVRDYGLTIIFSHHVSKASNGALVQSSARGGSALVDACRWVANLRTMDEKTAEKFEIEDFRSYVEFDVSKSNYAPKLPATIYFKRSEHGVLVPVNLEFQRLRSKSQLLRSILSEERKQGRTYTRQELLYRPNGTEVRGQMECKRQQISDALDFALKEGWIEIASLSQVEGAGRPKGILIAQNGGVEL